MRNYKIQWISLLTLLLGSLVCNPLFAAMYLCIGEIKGDVTADGYEDCIDIDSFSDGVVRSISNVGGGGRDTSNPQFSEISLGKSMDSSSLELRKQAAVGRPLDMNIHFVQTGAESLCEYYRVQLEDGIVSSHSTSNAADQPYESLSINFTRIRYTLFQSDAKGCGISSTTWGFDLAANTEL